MKPPKDPHLLSGAYALDAVSSEEAASVEAAMRSSEELRGEVAELTDTAVVLGLSVPPAEPPPALRARLLDLIDTTPQLPPEAVEAEAEAEPAVAPPVRVPEGEHVAPRRRAWRRRPAVLLAALAAAVLVVGFGGGLAVDRLLQPPAQTAEFAHLTSASDVQRTRAPVAGGGTATVYWSDSLNESALVLDGVAAPAGKSLQMWVVAGGTPRSAGLYTPEDGDRFELMRGALQPGQAVAVTVEPAGGSTKPTTTPIVVLPTA